LVPGEPTLRPVSDLAGKRLKLLRPACRLRSLRNALMNKKSNDGGGLTRVVNAVARTPALGQNVAPAIGTR